MDLRPALLVTLLAVLAACSSSAAPSAAPPAAPVAPVATSTPGPATSGTGTLWLCRPGITENPCGPEGLEATVVDGSGAVEEFPTGPTPSVDCFYVYPTVSRVVALNAPRAVDADLVAVARAQAARFSEVCRVFAPVYRQITLSGIFTGRYDDPGARGTAEQDVLASWRDYLANDNDGRGVVLLGHSQGARTLTGLLADTITQDPAARERVVSALLLGGDVTAPTAGGVTSAGLPACETPGQTGCLVAYSAYAATPPADALFGRTSEPGRQVVCTDPSLLAGGDGALRPYLPTAALAPGLGAGTTGVTTGFAAYPGQLRGQCRSDAGASYLRVALAPGARLAVPPQRLGPRWGLHDADVNVALGDLVEVVRRQAAAYQAAGA